jgi:hypothetical protein
MTRNSAEANRDLLSAVMSDLVRGDTQLKAPHSGKWEWWTDSRKRSRTICVRLCWPDVADLTIARRGVGTDGRMQELDSFACDIEHLPKLIHSLQRALVVAHDRGLIKQTPKK